MELARNVEKSFYNAYRDRFHQDMDEMKMHKLMYLVQRESLMWNKDVLFEEAFYGWRFGPVLKSVRDEYRNPQPYMDVSGEVSPMTRNLVEAVMERYGSESSWSLSRMSHDEFSWKCARKGLAPNDNGNVPLDMNAMKLDAARELATRNSVGQ